jgi:hypothetical protein
VVAHILPAEIVGDDEEDVGFAVSRIRGSDAAEQRQSACERDADEVLFGCLSVFSFLVSWVSQ